MVLAALTACPMRVVPEKRSSVSRAARGPRRLTRSVPSSGVATVYERTRVFRVTEPLRLSAVAAVQGVTMSCSIWARAASSG